MKHKSGPSQQLKEAVSLVFLKLSKSDCYKVNYLEKKYSEHTKYS